MEQSTKQTNDIFIGICGNIATEEESLRQDDYSLDGEIVALTYFIISKLNTVILCLLAR